MGVSLCLQNVSPLCKNNKTMENNDKANEYAYKALLGSIFGTAKPVDENPITARRRTIWLHENFTDDEIWEMFDILKWQQELKN